MSTKLKRFLITMLILVMSVSIFVMPANAATPNETVEIPVNLKLSGYLPEKAETFNIVLKATDASYPMPTGAVNGVYTLAMSDDGTGKDSDNLSIHYNKLGVYTYTVSQEAGTNGNCYQDTRVYDVTVTVVNDGKGGFESVVAIYIQGDETKTKQDSLDFENRYAIPVAVELTAIKTLNSKTPKDEQFTFILKDADGEEIEKVKNEGQNVTFTTLVFDQEGTYTFKISEEKGTESKIIYDDSVYTVTIKVEKDENGDYEAKVSYRKGLLSYEGTPKFANKTKSSSPQTGDMFRMGLWIGLLAVSGIALVILVIMNVKKRKK